MLVIRCVEIFADVSYQVWLGFSLMLVIRCVGIFADVSYQVWPDFR